MKYLRRRAYKIMTDLISSQETATWMKQFTTRSKSMIMKNEATYG